MHFAEEIKKPETGKKNEQHTYTHRERTQWIRHCVFDFHSLNFIGWDGAQKARVSTHWKIEYGVRSLYQPMWRLKKKKNCTSCRGWRWNGWGREGIVFSTLLLSSHFMFFSLYSTSSVPFTTLSLTLSYSLEIQLDVMHMNQLEYFNLYLAPFVFDLINLWKSIIYNFGKLPMQYDAMRCAGWISSNTKFDGIHLGTWQCDECPIKYGKYLNSWTVTTPYSIRMQWIAHRVEMWSHNWTHSFERKTEMCINFFMLNALQPLSSHLSCLHLINCHELSVSDFRILSQLRM